MNTQQLIEEKIALLKTQEIENVEIEEYIKEALELAFMKTIAPKINSLPREEYEKMVQLIQSEQPCQAIELLGKDDNLDLDEQIFTLHLKEILEMK